MIGLLSSPVGRFRVVAIAEAVSWLGLLVGMFFKYVAVHNDIGVKIMGPIHGALFVAYVLCTLEAMTHLKRNAAVVALGLLAAVPPFATLWFERWVLREQRAARAE